MHGHSHLCTHTHAHTTWLTPASTELIAEMSSKGFCFESAIRFLSCRSAETWPSKTEREASDLPRSLFPLTDPIIKSDIHWKVHWISRFALLPLNLKSLLNVLLTSFHCMQLCLHGLPEWKGKTGQGRYGAAHRGGELWPCSGEGLGSIREHNTSSIQPSVAACCYPQWSPLPGSPWAERPPGAPTAIRRSFTTFSPLCLDHCLEREEKLNNRGDTRGTIVFRGHLNPQQTVSTSVGSAWIDRHCVHRGQKGSLPCGQSHWKGYSVVLLCMRGIWSPSPFSRVWTTLWCLWSDFVLLKSRGKRWSGALRAGPFFPWPALLEGWRRLLSYTWSKKNASKSAGSVARIEGAKGWRYEEGKNTVTCGV